MPAVSLLASGAPNRKRLPPLSLFFPSRSGLYLHTDRLFLVPSCRLGDYASGTNHTLPTSAFARQYSGVSTSSFLKHITSQQLTAEGLKLLGPTVDHLAQIEGLDAHARAVTLRLASADIQ